VKADAEKWCQRHVGSTLATGNAESSLCPTLHPTVRPTFRVTRGQRPPCEAMSNHIRAITWGSPCDLRALARSQDLDEPGFLIPPRFEVDAVVTDLRPMM
jgi:hypothetical protein